MSQSLFSQISYEARAGLVEDLWSITQTGVIDTCYWVTANEATDGLLVADLVWMSINSSSCTLWYLLPKGALHNHLI